MIVRFPKMDEKWLDHKEIAAALDLSITRTVEVLRDVRHQLDELTKTDGIERYRQVGRSFLYDPIAVGMARQRDTKRGAKPKKSA